MRLKRNSQLRKPNSLFARRWLLVGILLMLVLFGHEVLMTADATAGQLATAGQVGFSTLDHDAQDAIHGQSLMAMPDRHRSQPDADCGVNPNIATLQGGGSSTEVIPTAIAESESPASITFGAGTGVAPSTPPNVRRALLQVYRI